MDHCDSFGRSEKGYTYVASPQSIVILKGAQDTINSSLDTDTTYISLRKPDNDLSLHLPPQAAIMQARILLYQAAMLRAYNQHKGIMMLVTKDTARLVTISPASSHLWSYLGAD
jgi:hypothetical protein